MRRTHWQLHSCNLYLHVDAEDEWTGLYAGGLRIDRGATAQTADTLASLMSLKLAVCRVDMRGAKAVAVPRPGADRDAMLAEIAEALRPNLDSGYLLGEDLGTTSADVVAIYGTAGVDPVQMVADHNARRGVRLDLPAGLSLGDLMNEEFAGRLAGTGAVAALVAAGSSGSSDLRGATASVQGFGTVGLAAAEELVRHGVRVVTVVDADGYMNDPDGLDVAALARARSTEGLVARAEIPDSVRQGPPEQWTRLDAEILVPAAVADAITEADLASLSSRVTHVVEGANGPVPEDVELALESRGIVVIPDFIANAGSAVAFGLLATGAATVENVSAQYLNRIQDAVRRCRAHAGVPFRVAASREAREFMALTGTTAKGA